MITLFFRRKSIHKKLTKRNCKLSWWIKYLDLTRNAIFSFEAFCSTIKFIWLFMDEWNIDFVFRLSRFVIENGEHRRLCYQRELAWVTLGVGIFHKSASELCLHITWLNARFQLEPLHLTRLSIWNCFMHVAITLTCGNLWI